MSATYLMQTELLDDESLFWDRYHTQPLARQKKIDQLIFKKDKKLSLAAGLVFQAGLADYGLGKQQITISCHEDGKPYICEYPELFFSISHSENLAICSFSSREIGVDVEKRVPIDLEIARQFFYGAEYQDIIASDDPLNTFFDYWVLKESYMKATGMGFKLSLDAFRIVLEDEIRVYVDNILMPYGFYNTTVFENYKLAICTKGGLPEPELHVL